MNSALDLLADKKVTFVPPAENLVKMIPENKIDALRAEKLERDIQEIEKSDDPVTVARAKIVAAQACGWKAPHLQLAAALNLPKTLNALHAANAPLTKDKNDNYPLDVALQANAKDSITTIIENKAIPYAYHPRSVGTCNQDALLNFYANMNKRRAGDSEALMRLNYDVATQCSKDNLRALVQKSILRMPSYQEFRSATSLESAEKIGMTAKLLTLYTQSPKDLPADLYEQIKRCAITAHVQIHLPWVYQKTPESVRNDLLNILTTHPITLTQDDTELAWNLLASTLGDDDLYNAVISLLKEQKFPFPDVDFSTQLLSAHIRFFPSNIFPRLLEIGADVNHTTSETPAHTPWSSKPANSRERSSLPSALDAAINNFSLSDKAIKWLKKNGLKVRRQQWLDLLIESSIIDTTRPTSHEERLNIISANEKKLEKTYIILKANPDLVLDTKTADHLCTIMEHLRANNIFFDHQMDYIIDRAWRHTSDSMYPRGKRLAAWEDFFSSFFVTNAQNQTEQQEGSPRIEDLV
jgi:hypothetical protein